MLPYLLPTLEHGSAHVMTGLATLMEISKKEEISPQAISCYHPIKRQGLPPLE